MNGPLRHVQSNDSRQRVKVWRQLRVRLKGHRTRSMRQSEVFRCPEGTRGGRMVRMVLTGIMRDAVRWIRRLNHLQTKVLQVHLLLQVSIVVLVVFLSVVVLHLLHGLLHRSFDSLVEREYTFLLPVTPCWRS